MPIRPVTSLAASVLRGGISLLALSAAAAGASTASAWLNPPTACNGVPKQERDGLLPRAIGGGGVSSASPSSSPPPPLSRRTVPFATSFLGGKIRSPDTPCVNRSRLGRRTGGVAMCESSSSTSTSTEIATDPNAESSSDNDSPLPFDTRGSAYEMLRHPCRSLAESHVIFGPLRGPGKIERYDVYRLRGEDEDEAEAEDDSFAPPGGGSTGGGVVGEVAVADIRFGRSLNGHDGIVHGGIICLLFDDAMGWGYDALVLTEREKRRRKRRKAPVVDTHLEVEVGEGGRDSRNSDEEAIPTIVTANLSVDFRAPLPADTEAIVRIRHDGTRGRKIYFSARLESADGETLFAEATALFVIPRGKI